MVDPIPSVSHAATVAASFDERAPSYDESVMHREVADAAAEFVDLTGVATVLDIATGTGLVLRALPVLKTDVSLVGVDISPGMLAIVRRELPGARFLEAPAEDLPFRDSAFELLTCVTAMHLMADPAAVLAEMARVLTPGGRLVLATFQLPPGRTPAQRSYRTNHRDFETPDLIGEFAAPMGFDVTRSALGQYGDDTCVLTELLLEGHPPGY